MIKEVIMPKLGQTVEEADVERWHKKEGDSVEKGEILLEITTDKATLEVEAFTSGVLRKILVLDGQTVPVNTVIAYIGDPGDPIPETAPPPVKEKAAKPEAEARAAGAPAGAGLAATAVAPKPAAAPAGKGFISPRARRKAKDSKVPVRFLRGTGPNGRIIEQNVLDYIRKRAQLPITPVALNLAYQRNIDLLSLKGTGPNGKITQEDVEKAPLAPEPAAAAGVRRIPLTAMRRIIAQRLTESKTTIPHFYLDMDIDMSAAILFRKDLNEKGKVKVSFNDLLMRACVLAFKQVPNMNAAWGGDCTIYREQVDLGLAVAIEEGLIVPVLRNVNNKSISDIARESAVLVEKARKKRLTPDEYGSASITVSNLGMFGVDRVFPIINPGESGILGVGRIAEKVVVMNGGIHIRNMMPVVLACDHRIVDGATGAQFFKAVKDAMETPSGLV